MTRAYRTRQFTRTDEHVVPVLRFGDPRHGTPNGYTNFKCRCEPCKSAWSDYQKAYYQARKAKGGVA